MIGGVRPDKSNHERPTRRVAEIDLAGIADALADNSGETTWWYDPSTGQVEMTAPEWDGLDEDDEDDEDDPHERGLVAIEPTGSRAAYLDMVEFAEATGNVRASELLLRALEGRGAFRRFRDTLYEFPDLRERWFEYTNSAGECRAIDWLLDEDYIDPEDAEAERAARTATMTDVLVAISSPGTDVFEETELSDRWAEIRELIDADRTITIVRDGQTWAVISPHPTDRRH